MTTANFKLQNIFVCLPLQQIVKIELNLASQITKQQFLLKLIQRECVIGRFVLLPLLKSTNPFYSVKLFSKPDSNIILDTSYHFDFNETIQQPKSQNINKCEDMSNENFYIHTTITYKFNTLSQNQLHHSHSNDNTLLIALSIKQFQMKLAQFYEDIDFDSVKKALKCFDKLDFNQENCASTGEKNEAEVERKDCCQDECLKLNNVEVVCCEEKDLNGDGRPCKSKSTLFPQPFSTYSQDKTANANSNSITLQNLVDAVNSVYSFSSLDKEQLNQFNQQSFINTSVFSDLKKLLHNLVRHGWCRIQCSSELAKYFTNYQKNFIIPYFQNDPEHNLSTHHLVDCGTWTAGFQGHYEKFGFELFRASHSQISGINATINSENNIANINGPNQTKQKRFSSFMQRLKRNKNTNNSLSLSSSSSSSRSTAQKLKNLLKFKSKSNRNLNENINKNKSQTSSQQQSANSLDKVSSKKRKKALKNYEENHDKMNSQRRCPHYFRNLHSEYYDQMEKLGQLVSQALSFLLFDNSCWKYFQDDLNESEESENSLSCENNFLCCYNNPLCESHLNMILLNPDKFTNNEDNKVPVSENRECTEQYEQEKISLNEKNEDLTQICTSKGLLTVVPPQVIKTGIQVFDQQEGQIDCDKFLLSKNIEQDSKQKQHNPINSQFEHNNHQESNPNPTSSSIVIFVGETLQRMTGNYLTTTLYRRKVKNLKSNEEICSSQIFKPSTLSDNEPVDLQNSIEKLPVLMSTELQFYANSKNHIRLNNLNENISRILPATIVPTNQYLNITKSLNKRTNLDFLIDQILLPNVINIGQVVLDKLKCSNNKKEQNLTTSPFLDTIIRMNGYNNSQNNDSMSNFSYSPLHSSDKSNFTFSQKQFNSAFKSSVKINNKCKKLNVDFKQTPSPILTRAMTSPASIRSKSSNKSKINEYLNSNIVNGTTKQSQFYSKRQFYFQ